MTDALIQDAIARPRRWVFNYDRLVDSLFWLTMFSGSVVFIEPSPYDILILGTLLLWAFGGFSIHRAVLPQLMFLALWVLGGFIGLIPYWDEPDPVSFMVHTLFIGSTGMFFALFISQRTPRRMELLLTGYVASCVLAAAIAVITWYTGFGADGDWIRDGRAMAPFKDPNGGLGSYLVTGVLYLVQRLMLGPCRHLWLALPSLALILSALFLSFSRGSWGAAVISTVLMVFFLFRTADTPKMRRTIIGGAVAVVVMAGAGLAAALTAPCVNAFFFERAAVEQDYDAGPNGRFGNQITRCPSW